MKYSVETVSKLASEFAKATQKDKNLTYKDSKEQELKQKFNKPVNSLQDLLEKLNSFADYNLIKSNPFYSFRARLGSTASMIDKLLNRSEPAVIVGFTTDSPMYDASGKGEAGLKYLKAILKNVPNAKIEFVDYDSVVDSSTPTSVPDTYYVYTIKL